MRLHYLYKTMLGLIFLILLLSMCSCCSKPPSKGSIQSVQGIELLPLGASFSFLDSEGKLTTITKIDSVRVVVEQEQPKRQRSAPFIHIGSEGKDKSETTKADNGGVVGKDKSDNKGASDSGNKSKVKTTSNSFPWFVWVILALGLVFIVWWKIK